ncbi:alkene reductase [Maritimibacter sp. DP07]|uniref:Alkene reductase n=1 Tax=Maritimibacter harenae TaxID=2606218 RepID=A0A845M4T3_9RHOB|nr:alkene reductase [Maritimibacter harenae]MZR13408.1 alkene reductase [Maritimibacter harenae]
MTGTDLFGPAKLGAFDLQNRVAMAPMTRHRALDGGWTPADYAPDYYGARSSAGLIITEATQCSAGAAGYPRTPGLWCDRHLDVWTKVVAAIQAGGAKAVLQVWHCGRISHPDNLPTGHDVIGPSPVAADAFNISDKQGGVQVQMPVPMEMSEAAIEQVIAEYAQCARYAKAAGFDGLEIHAANGYLLEQFASSNTNLRTDAWGGSVENRLRLQDRVIAVVAEVFGHDRVGIRFSPFGTFNDIHDDDPLGIYIAKLKHAERSGVGYVHVIRPSVSGNVDSDAPMPKADVVAIAREYFSGLLIAAGQFDRAESEAELAAGKCDIIAFGRPFLANPDLVERLKSGAPLKQPRTELIYAGGREGYVDDIAAV